MNDKRKPGRPATGQTTVTVRIPIALKPAVAELVTTFHRLKWQPARQPGQVNQEPGDSHDAKV